MLGKLRRPSTAGLGLRSDGIMRMQKCNDNDDDDEFFRPSFSEIKKHYYPSPILRKSIEEVHSLQEDSLIMDLDMK